MNVTAQIRILYRQGARVLTRKDIPARVAIQIDDVEIPFLLDFLAEDQRVPKVVAGVKKENAKIGFDMRRHVQQGHALCLKGSAHGNIRREGIHRPADDLLGCLLFELRRKRIHFFFIEHEQKLYPL